MSSEIVTPLMSALLVFGVLGLGCWIAWRAYARRLSVGLGAGAVLPGVSFVEELTWSIVLPFLLLAGLVGVVVWQRWSRSSATVTRWGARARRKAGVASSLDIVRRASVRAMRGQARVVRPSLAGMARRDLRRVPATEFALKLCRVGVQYVWSSVQVVVVVFGGPRKGKSSLLVGRIIDAPGAVLATSTRTDLLVATRPFRERRGPVLVFNPVGLGGPEYASTLSFDPLTGCTDPVAAAERAYDMVTAAAEPGAGGLGGDRGYWDGQGRRVLAALMHAAALGGRSMADVQRWVADPDSARAELAALLRRSPEPAFIADAEQFVDTNERTRSSITSTIMPALGWLTNPSAARCATSGRPLVVEELLESRATVHLLGGEEAHVAPLVCALTGYVAREARRLAALRPSGRLEPPLLLALDEAALICPVPLDRWSADMGGRGVSIVAAFQSRSQMIDRYGQARAATIMNNAGAKVLFGGTSDRDDLQWWSTLAGERDEPVATTSPHGRVSSRTVRKVAVLAPAQLAQLPEFKVVVFAPGLAPVIGWAERWWLRPDVQALQRPESWPVRARAMRDQLRGQAAGAGGACQAWCAYRTGVITDAVRRATAVGRLWIVRRVAQFAAESRASQAAPDAGSVSEEPVRPEARPRLVEPSSSDVGQETAGARVIRFPRRGGTDTTGPADADVTGEGAPR